MSIASIVSNAFDAAVGNEKSASTSLKDFLTKFSDSSGKYANQLNPLNTFEVSFKFYPTVDPTNVGNSKGDRDWLKDLGESLESSAIGAAKNALNNITGGLLGSIKNDKDGVMTQHKDFKDAGKNSFMHYLAPANLLVGDENEWFGKAGQSNSPLELQLGYYVQSITVPQLKIPEGGKSTTWVGEYPVNGLYVQPDNNQLQMEVINTKLPLIERIFYPWMREVTLPFWAYDKQPYTTATITIDFNKHTDLKYIFYGCRPQQLGTMQPNQENDQCFKRNVTFIFDFMAIDSKMTTMDDWKDKLMGAAGTLLNSAAGMLNMN